MAMDIIITHKLLRLKAAPARRIDPRSAPIQLVVSTAMLTPNDAKRFARCLAAGGVAVFPADTVYGLACDPLGGEAVRRLYELKGRPAERPAAVMFFSLPPALDALPQLGARERAALDALLPGPLTVLLPNPRRRFPLTGGSDSLGLRVPLLPARLAALGAVEVPVMQSSANLSGEREARRLADVPPTLLAGADLVLDGGELPGIASTVLDLREYEAHGRWRIVRAGPVDPAELRQALG
jgi:L-threonylcarbamoyladenylate synthase